MRRTALAISTLLALLLLAPSASASLFEDTFDGSGALDPDKWDVTTQDFTVARSSDWAVFDVDNGSSTSYGTALTDDAWDPGDYALGLTWSTSFKSTGGDAPKVYAFLFESLAGNLSVYTRYDGSTAFVVIDALGVSTALRDGLGSTFKPTSGNSYTQYLTVDLDDTTITATLSATTDGTHYTDYTASVSHQLSTVADRAGNFGMEVYDGAAGSDKTVQFDSVLLTPEPATLVLMGAGVAILGMVRRKRSRTR